MVQHYIEEIGRPDHLRLVSNSDVLCPRTMVKDATASYSEKEMHAALEVNIPNYATTIVTTDDVVDSISSL